jgi:excisionase family DNA binding protein
MPAPNGNKQGPRDGSRLRTVAQAAEERPWLTERYLRRLIYERRIEYFKVGGRVLVDLDQLDRFVEAHRVGVA